MRWSQAREEVAGARNALHEIREKGCDAPSPSMYYDNDTGYQCRCMVCSRCDHHTGNNTQGHYWARCRVTGTTREFHFCCPDDCELEKGS